VIHATRAVVLNHVKYAETSVIVHIYTELFGRQSYMVNHVRSAKAKGKTIFLQPLALLDLQVYRSQKKEVQRIKDFRISRPFTAIPFDQSKRSVAFFVTETLNRALREEESNPPLFHYIFEQIVALDEETIPAHIFHILFLAGLTNFLGFAPDFSNQQQWQYFDLQNSELCYHQPSHRHFLMGDDVTYWKALFDGDMALMTQLPAQKRNILADALLDYYALHLEGFGNIKSFDVLKDFYSR
jgi:DNA repair protein RecO (recombination protein O)